MIITKEDEVKSQDVSPELNKFWTVVVVVVAYVELKSKDAI